MQSNCFSGVYGNFSAACAALIFGAGLFFAADPARGDFVNELDQSPLDTATPIHGQESYGASSLGSGPLGGSQGGGNPFAGSRPFVAGTSLQTSNSNPICEFVMPEFNFGGASGPTSRRPRSSESQPVESTGSSGTGTGTSWHSGSGPTTNVPTLPDFVVDPSLYHGGYRSAASNTHSSTYSTYSASSTYSAFTSQDLTPANQAPLAADEPAESADDSTLTAFSAMSLLNSVDFSTVPSPSAAPLLAIGALALPGRRPARR